MHLMSSCMPILNGIFKDLPQIHCSRSRRRFQHDIVDDLHRRPRLRNVQTAKTLGELVNCNITPLPTRNKRVHKTTTRIDVCKEMPNIN